MKQLIARIDDRLHAQLKAQAAAEHRSLNALVKDALASAVDDAPAERERVRERGMQLEIELLPATEVASDREAREVAIGSFRGTGPMLDELLREDRGDPDQI